LIFFILFYVFPSRARAREAGPLCGKRASAGNGGPSAPCGKRASAGNGGPSALCGNGLFTIRSDKRKIVFRCTSGYASRRHEFTPLVETARRAAYNLHLSHLFNVFEKTFFFFLNIPLLLNLSELFCLSILIFFVFILISTLIFYFNTL